MAVVAWELFADDVWAAAVRVPSVRHPVVARADLDDTSAPEGSHNMVAMITAPSPSRCPEAAGIKVARTCGDETRIVILTVSERERDLLDAVAAGAVGHLLKSTSGPELRAALTRAAAGEPVSCPALAALVLGGFRRLAKASSGTSPLSEREREVLQLVAGPHVQVHRPDLFIAERTIEKPRAQHPQKLHLCRKQELIRYALEHGIE